MSEMLAVTPRATGVKGQLKGRKPSGGHMVLPPEKKEPTLATLGISKRESGLAEGTTGRGALVGQKKAVTWCYRLNQKKAPHRPEKRGQNDPVIPERTADKLAAEYGVSPATVKCSK